MYSGGGASMEAMNVTSQGAGTPADDLAGIAQGIASMPEKELIALLTEIDSALRETHDIGLREMASYIDRNGQKQRQSQQQQSAPAADQQPTGGPQSGRLVMR